MHSTTVTPVPSLLNQPIKAETTAGRLKAITWKGNPLPVRIVGEWPSLYRISMTVNGDPVIAEIARRDEGWALLRWWGSEAWMPPGAAARERGVR